MLDYKKVLLFVFLSIAVLAVAELMFYNSKNKLKAGWSV